MWIIDDFHNASALFKDDPVGDHAFNKSEDGMFGLDLSNTDKNCHDLDGSQLGSEDRDKEDSVEVATSESSNGSW